MGFCMQTEVLQKIVDRLVCLHKNMLVNLVRPHNTFHSSLEISNCTFSLSFSPPYFTGPAASRVYQWVGTTRIPSYWCHFTVGVGILLLSWEVINELILD